MNKTLDFPLEIKSINEDGTFSGYGSVFGVVDSYDEVVAQGAFSDTLAAAKQSGKMPALLWQHRSGEPIGVYTDMAEDNIGLKVEGKLALKTSRGMEAYELMKMKAINGLSIGFMPREDSFDRVTGIRTLKKVDLWEVSLVTFPANDAARVQSVKSIEDLPDLKSAEAYLRDSAGWSRSQALAFIAKIKSLGQSDSDEGMQQIIEALKERSRFLPA